MPTPNLSVEAQAKLRAAIMALDLDGSARFSFSRRLARDNGWAADFAERVIVEYKKFVYLAATCAHPVTPSDEVDQAWHLHLVYTRSYWDELCGQILGFPLHHGPTQGGTVESHKFQDWYAQTLWAYQAAYGEPPPPDIWPPVGIRFAQAPHFRRVNLRHTLVVPRLRWPRGGNWRTWWPLLGILALAGCTARLPLNPLNWYGTEFLILYWSLGLTLIPLALALQRRGRGPKPAICPQHFLTTYELARLASHGQLVADSALAALAYAGKIELLPQRQVRRTVAAPPDEPYERAVWNLLPAAGWADVARVRTMAMTPVVGALKVLDQALEAQGLLLPAPTRHRLNQIPLLTILAIGLLGLAKLMVGLTRGRPVGLLLVSMAMLLLAVWYWRRHPAWATGLGAAVLNTEGARIQAQRYAQPLSGAHVALTVALFGLSDLQALGLSYIAEHLAPPADSGTDGSGSGCGSSDGGASSGCGGCGGCGGD